MMNLMHSTTKTMRECKEKTAGISVLIWPGVRGDQ